MRDTNSVTVYNNQALNIGNITKLGKEFPLARGWKRMLLHFQFDITIGTGTTPIADGLLQIIQKIYLKTDKGEVPVNVGALPLYFDAHLRDGTLPQIDTLAASNGTYNVYIPIEFVNKGTVRENDTIFDSGRYKSVDLEITLGTIAALFGTPGTATVTCTLNLEVETTPDVLPFQAQPILYRCYYSENPVDASVQQYIDMMRARDLAVSRIMAHTATGATDGTPFTGVRSNAILNLITVEDFDKRYLQNKVAGILQANNKVDRSLEAVATGIYYVDFTKDKSLFSSVYTGNKSKFRYSWTNAGGVVANDQVSLFVDGVRALAK